MNTRERARALAQAASAFPGFGPGSEEALLHLIHTELGSEDTLEPWAPPRRTRAVAPGTILHIISGNTPHAGLQSLLRGLLLGSHNRCKLPSAGLPELEAFYARLPEALARRVELARTLPPEWLAEADAVVVFGSDTTVQALREQVRPEAIFLPHGHRVSFGIVFDDSALASLPGAVEDVCLFDQQGCLSPHLFYVAPEQALAYAERLAEALEAVAPAHPVLTLEEVAAIVAVREEAAFIPGARLWQNAEATPRWSVIYDPRPGFTPSCLNRTVFIKPLPADLPAAVAPVRAYLSCAGIWPPTPAHAERAAATGVSRVCPIGQMQRPPLTWRQDGQPVLAPLVRWVDYELA